MYKINTKGDRGDTERQTNIKNKFRKSFTKILRQNEWRTNYCALQMEERESFCSTDFSKQKKRRINPEYSARLSAEFSVRAHIRLDGQTVPLDGEPVSSGDPTCGRD